MNGLNIRPVDPEFELKECFFHFFLDGTFCDTKILTSDDVVNAHKLILNQNEKFKDLISKEDDDKIVVLDLTKFSSRAIKMAIHGIYRGTIIYCREFENEVQELVNFFFPKSNIIRQDDEPINHLIETKNIKEEPDVMVIEDSPPIKTNIKEEPDVMVIEDSPPIKTEDIKEEPAERLPNIIIIEDSPPKEVNPDKRKKNLPGTSKDTGDTEESCVLPYTSTQIKVEPPVTQPEARAGSSQVQDSNCVIRPEAKRPKKRILKSSESALNGGSEDLNSKEPKRIKVFHDNVLDKNDKKMKKSPNKEEKKDTGCIKSKSREAPKGKNKNAVSFIEKKVTPDKRKKNLPGTSKDTGDTGESCVLPYTSTQTKVEPPEQPEARAGFSRFWNYYCVNRPEAKRPKKHILKSSESGSEDLNSKEPKRIKVIHDNVLDKNEKKIKKSPNKEEKKDTGWIKSKSREAPKGINKNAVITKNVLDKTDKKIKKSPNKEEKKDTGSIKSKSREAPKGINKNAVITKNVLDKTDKKIKKSPNKEEKKDTGWIKSKSREAPKGINKNAVITKNVLDKTDKKIKKSPNKEEKKDTGSIKSKSRKAPKGKKNKAANFIEKVILTGITKNCAPYCMICLVKDDGYIDHIKQHRKPLIKKYQCEYCLKIFYKTNMLEWHIKDFCKQNTSGRK